MRLKLNRFLFIVMLGFYGLDSHSKACPKFLVSILSFTQKANAAIDRNLFLRDSVGSWATSPVEQPSKSLVEKISKRGLNTVGRLVNSALVFSPFPIPKKYRNFLNTEYRVLNLFDKSFKAGGGIFSQLSEKEISLLREKGLLEAFKNKDEYLAKHRYLVRTHKVVRVAYLSAVWSFLIANLALHQEIRDPQNTLSFTQYLSKPLEKNQIQVIFNLVPLPHVAVRIDDRVYSFNEEHFYANYVGDYFLEQTMTAQARDSALNFPDSKMVFTIDSDEQKIDELHAYLNNKSYRTWNNVYFVNTCSSEIAKALKIVDFEIPWAIRASPSQVANYLLLKSKVTNNPISFHFVLMGDQYAPHAERAAYLSQLESKFFLFNFVWLKASDLVLDFSGKYFEQPRDIPSSVYKRIATISINEVRHLEPFVQQMKNIVQKYSSNEIELYQAAVATKTLEAVYRSKVDSERNKIVKALEQKRLSFEMRWHLELVESHLNLSVAEFERLKNQIR